MRQAQTSHAWNHQKALPASGGYAAAAASSKAAAAAVANAEAMEAAVEQLSAWDANTRKYALQSLGLQGDAASDHTGEIAKLLKDEESPDVRKAAAIALGRVGPAAGGEAFELAAALRDEDAGVRTEAAKALGLLGQKAAVRYADKVAALAKDDDDDVAMAGVSCLAALGEAARLAPFVNSPLPSVARAALVEVGRCPVAREQHAQLITAALKHKDMAVRLAAVQASGELGPGCGEEQLSCLASLRMSDKQVKVRRAAVQALGRAAAAGAPHLVSFLRDSDEGVRHFAAETLAATGGEVSASAAVPLLEDADAAVRRAALLALGRMKDSARSTAAKVSGCLCDSDFAARLAAIQALNDMGAEDQASALGALAKDASKGVRQAAVAALAKMGAAGAVEALTFLEDADPSVRQSAVKVYSPLHSKLKADLAKHHAGAVALCLLDEDWRVRLAAVVALGDLHAHGFVEQVADLSSDPDQQVRRSAVMALEKMGSSPALAARFLGDSDPVVRKDAERVFAALGGGRGAAGGDDSDLSEAD